MQPESTSSSGSFGARLVVVTVILFAAAFYLADASRAETVPPREALSTLPMELGGWTGRREADFSPEIMAQLGADDYITRSYRRAGGLIGLYIGYYTSQREGDTIHSPLNCLPGAGWQPVEQSHAIIQVPASPDGATAPIEVNRVIVQKGSDRQLVFYWYQSHGRIVASEYWGKVYTVLDSVRYNRTDAALVRVIAPMQEDDSVAEIEPITVSFIQSLFPRLGRHLPV